MAEQLPEASLTTAGHNVTQSTYKANGRIIARRDSISSVA
ncbi:MAG: hypothetical protein OJF50_004291 [Nitrospira sp.]|nr:hypothetical protein [Nitrospira sp.]